MQGDGWGLQVPVCVCVCLPPPTRQHHSWKERTAYWSHAWLVLPTNAEDCCNVTRWHIRGLTKRECKPLSDRG